jgi:hypothetical protein
MVKTKGKNKTKKYLGGSGRNYGESYQGEMRGPPMGYSMGHPAMMGYYPMSHHPMGYPMGHPAMMSHHPMGYQMGHPAMMSHPMGYPMGHPMSHHPMGYPMGHPMRPPIDQSTMGQAAEPLNKENIDKVNTYNVEGTTFFEQPGSGIIPFPNGNLTHSNPIELNNNRSISNPSISNMSNNNLSKNNRSISNLSNNNRRSSSKNNHSKNNRSKNNESNRSSIENKVHITHPELRRLKTDSRESLHELLQDTRKRTEFVTTIRILLNRMKFPTKIMVLNHIYKEHKNDFYINFDNGSHLSIHYNRKYGGEKGHIHISDESTGITIRIVIFFDDINQEHVIGMCYHDYEHQDLKFLSKVCSKSIKMLLEKYTPNTYIIKKICRIEP